MTLFLRLLDVGAPQKADALRTALQEGGISIFEVEPSAFKKVPGSPFSYWVSTAVRAAFGRHRPLQEDYFSVRGAYTTDDFRFYRLMWEIPAGFLAERREDTQSDRAYVALAKGGQHSRFYSDIYLAVRWAGDGREAKAFLAAYRERKGWGTDWSACLNGYEHYFRPGLTWPLRTTSGLGVRVLPSGCIFTHKGPAAFVKTDSTNDLLALCAVLNSTPFGYLVAVQLAAADAAARSYEVGIIQTTPVPHFTFGERATLSQLARRAWSLKRTLDTGNETSLAFVLPALLQARLIPFDSRATEAELSEIQNAVDDLVFRVYDFQGEEPAGGGETWTLKSEHVSASAADESEDDDEGGESNSENTRASLHSWAVGVAFGRFDIRLATGEREAPPEPEPFDPLPARSPGMIPEADEAQLPARLLLVDDPGHSLDLTAQAVDVLERVGFPPENPEALRRWLARDFFPLHVKMYSKSRRKAPIYWQLATPSASYSVWLYLHAFSRDALYQVQEIAGMKLLHEERKLESLRAGLDPNPTAAERKELAIQESFVEELRAFLDEAKRIAPLWNPNLYDGVILNFAPLWRLVPHHKLWQKELKTTWDALCAGEYDWAHLAMHLWPERVVPKCASDRSLAIAHGLEEVFWVEGEDGKWKQRPIPTRPGEELVRERASPAVKAALKSLLEAPAAVSASGRGRPRHRRGNAGETA
jgi:hypothetical protein